MTRILVLTVIDELVDQEYESKVAQMLAFNPLKYSYDHEAPQKLAAGVPVIR